ncbi:DUF397 domain-containing protein [Streptomyces venezuelae]|uniref:DUF397 domain-containing protein n=1 Tax=Streptomyces venezuelae TaxID=54571 RepID=A0A5P2D0V6_STRVZ|nr:DUF397 domain-containing protein [Streptomyces venezuelae]QES48772.1 DUF397 domain-containing protein [Streptomyces venezuelae]
MSSNTGLRWFKSSYSSGEGDSCVAVALAWHKSSYSSGEGDDCVEVAACAHTVHVRDSKVTAGPELGVASGAWAAFVAGVARA